MWKRKRNNILAQNTKRTHQQPPHTYLSKFLCLFAEKQCHKIIVVGVTRGQKSWLPPSQLKKNPTQLFNVCSKPCKPYPRETPFTPHGTEKSKHNLVDINGPPLANGRSAPPFFHSPKTNTTFAIPPRHRAQQHTGS